MGNVIAARMCEREGLTLSVAYFAIKMHQSFTLNQSKFFTHFLSNFVYCFPPGRRRRRRRVCSMQDTHKFNRKTPA